MTTRVRLLQSRFFCSLSLDYSVHFCASNLISLLNCFDFLVFGLRRCAQSCSCSFRGAEKGEKEGKKDRKKRERKKGEKIDRKEMESVDNDSVYISIGRRILFIYFFYLDNVPEASNGYAAWPNCYGQTHASRRRLGSHRHGLSERMRQTEGHSPPALLCVLTATAAVG